MVTQNLSDKWISVSDAAILAGCTPQNIRLLAVQEKIPGQKVGTQWLLEKKHVAKYAKTPAKVGRKRSGRRKEQKTA